MLGWGEGARVRVVWGGYLQTGSQAVGIPFCHTLRARSAVAQKPALTKMAPIHA